MKFFIYGIFSFLFIFISAKAVYGSCYTGFACSIDKLEKAQKNKQDIIMETINKLFEKEINENLFFSKANKDTNYNDLFIYKYVLI